MLLLHELVKGRVHSTMKFLRFVSGLGWTCLLVTQNGFEGRQVSHTKVPDCISEGKLTPRYFSPYRYCLQYPIIQDLQCARNILWLKSWKGYKVASEKQVYKSQRTIKNLHHDFFKARVLLENHSFWCLP